MPDDVNNCLLALGNLTVANAAQQRDCLQLANGTSNFHNAVRAALGWPSRGVRGSLGFGRERLVPGL